MRGITLCALSMLVGFALFNAAQSSNILFALSVSSISHMNIMNPIMARLMEKGNNVTLVSPFPAKFNPSGVHVIETSSVFETISSFNKQNSLYELSKKSNLENFQNRVKMILGVARAIVTDPALKLLLNSGVQYDLVVVDAIYNDHLLAIPYMLKAPFVLLSASQLLPHIAWNMNIPLPPSVHPVFSAPFPSSMSFTQRLLNSVLTAGLVIQRYYNEKEVRAIVEEEFPGMPSLLEIERNASLILVNSFPTLNGPKPSMPYMLEIGGIHCRPAKKLENELAAIADASADHGFIYFSMGSATQGSSLPDELIIPLLKVFAKLNQTIIMKYEGQIPGLTKNVKLVQWTPQQDVLGHKNCKLFITHGGLLSLQEAVYHAVPVLAFPTFFDQNLNAMIAYESGFGHVINWHYTTVEETHSKLSQLMNDPKYKANAEKMSKLFKDRPIDPVDNSVYWLEYVMRTGGAQHLKSKAFEMSFFQYFLLDIFALLAIIVVTFSALVFLFIRFLVHRLAKIPIKALVPIVKKEN